ncbi:BRCA1-associated RING domain protein 1-like [Diadema antillarum]|uniref:BRCA1-associated RING domain protein 1-like n=1 Tax=Diadema antillarum TaxID=105358 RepID=UPI003A8889A6
MTGNVGMDSWASTKSALTSLERSLSCAVCLQLLNEPCTLGSCAHLICRDCATQHVGNSCPVCQAPAWAKDLQIKREIGMVVRLYRRLHRLINSAPENDATVKRKPNPEEASFMSESAESEDTATNFDVHGSESESMSMNSSEGTAEESVLSSHRPRRSRSCKRVQPCDNHNANVSNAKRMREELSKPKDTKCRRDYPENSLQIRESHVIQSNTLCESLDTREGMDTLKKSTSEQMLTYIDHLEAYPTRRKTRKLTREEELKAKRAVKLKKLAAANQMWHTVATVQAPDKVPCKHVSFSDGNLQTSISAKEEGSHDHTINDSGSVDTVNVGVCENMKENEDEQATGAKKCETKSSSRVRRMKWKGAKDAKHCDAGIAAARSTCVEKRKRRLSQKEQGKTKKYPKKATNEEEDKSNSEVIAQGDVQTSTGKDSKMVQSPDCSLLGSSRKKRTLGGHGPSSLKPSTASLHNGIIKKNKRGETPLHVACIKGDMDVAQSLLERGVDPNVKDNAGWTPLHEACNHGHTSLVDLLLDYGALINAPGFEHDSPLHDAVSNNRLDVVRTLRQRGASLQVRNVHGLTPLDLAATSQMKKALMTKPLADVTSDRNITGTFPRQHLWDQHPVLLASGLQSKEKAALQICAKLLKGRVVEKFSKEVTHLITSCEESNMCLRTMKYMQAILTGRWVLPFKWVESCLNEGKRVQEFEFEIQGTVADPESQAPRRARENLQKQFPGLFDGCHFYFSGTFTHPTPSKTELAHLIQLGGGTILNRQPKPDDDVIQVSTIVPYHAKSGSELAACAHFILYDHLGKRIPPSIRTNKICTVPVWWLLDCVSQFSILNPPKE